MGRLGEFEEDLPAAMIVYLAARASRVSKHAAGHRGQQYRARARRRGEWGKIVRRRALARQGLALTSRREAAVATRIARGIPIYDEGVPF
jgi:hypothetical protein